MPEVEPTAPVIAEPSPSPEAPVEAAAPGPVEAAPSVAPIAPVATEAQTLAPDPTTAASELQGLVGAAGGDSTLAIVLALVAVLGGGAAWKFYQKNSEQKHEFKMKELEIKAQQPTQSPPPCIVKHGELDAKLASVEGKVAKIDQKTAGMSVDGPSSDELDERLVKLERTVKALTAKKVIK